MFNLKKVIQEKTSKSKKGKLQEIEEELKKEKTEQPPTPDKEENTQEPRVVDATKSEMKESANKRLNFSEEEKKEMAYVFKDKHDRTKKEFGQEIDSLNRETNERLNILKKEFQKRIEEIQLEQDRKKTSLKERYEQKINRYSKLMSKLGDFTRAEELLTEPLKEVAEPEPLKEKFELKEVAEPIPITEEDKRLGMEINEFIQNLKNQ